MSEASCYTRPFRKEEAHLYKAMRLEALRAEPGNYGNSYEKEAAFPEDYWTTMVTDPLRGLFGLYCNDALIGITSLIINEENPDEAYLTQSYIRKAYRGYGLSKKLYKVRLDWARAHKLRRLTIGHKESNLPSKAAILRHGFRYARQEIRHWPDGSEEPMVYYLLHL